MVGLQFAPPAAGGRAATRHGASSAAGRGPFSAPRGLLYLFLVRSLVAEGVLRRVGASPGSASSAAGGWTISAVVGLLFSFRTRSWQPRASCGVSGRLPARGGRFCTVAAAVRGVARRQGRSAPGVGLFRPVEVCFIRCVRGPRRPRAFCGSSAPRVKLAGRGSQNYVFSPSDEGLGGGGLAAARQGARRACRGSPGRLLPCCL